MTTDTAAASPRLTSEERREQIVRAAIAVFGTRGYVGATTDEVARAAGVSQPYVVRLFGSKESLFIAALSETLDILLGAFRDALAHPSDDGLPTEKRIGKAYTGLLEVRGLHQTLLHAFLLGGHPVIGDCARDGFARVWEFFREEAGMSAEEAQRVLADGMLITVTIALRLVGGYDRDPRITELFDACFPTQLRTVLDIVPRAEEPW
jgi:AcrR family transcriptional regulator